MNVAVCSALVGPRTDPLRSPLVISKGSRHICASDRESVPDGWSRLYVHAGPTPVMAARRFKICVHEHVSVDYSIWMDAAYQLTVDPAMFAPLLMRHDLLALAHPFCASIEDEASSVVSRGLVQATTADAQVRRYRDEGLPPRATHWSTGFLVRRHDDRTARFNALWWREMERYGHPRDQLSFGFAVWLCGLTVGRLDGEYRDNPYATWKDRI